MASNVASDDFDDEFLTCEVCLNRFRDPKILPCLHTFCKECLKGWASCASKQRQMECPTCRVLVKLPGQGVDGLKTNFYVNKLLDFVATKKAVPKKVTSVGQCEVCERNVEGSKSYCGDCGILMCDSASCTPPPRIVKFPASSKGREAGPGREVTVEEPLKAEEGINKVSDIVSKLWALDHNRLTRGVEYDTSPYGDSLFSYVRWEELECIPTYKAFLKLLDNYEPGVYRPEEVTKKEQSNARAFLNRCLDTEVMEEAHAFLAKEGYVPASRKGFKDMLYEMWFTPHTRTYSDRAQGSYRSTAFEHTFVGQTRCGLEIGFQNWLRLCNEEGLGNIRHRGYNCCDCDDRIILTIDLERRGLTEIFVGTSPEFELAMYTVCSLAGDGLQADVILGDERVTIVSIMTHKVNGQIESCYPILQQQDLSVTDKDTESHTKGCLDPQDDSNDNLLAEGLDFMEYLEDQGFGPEVGKWMLKGIYEFDYTLWCGRRRSRTPFSQVLFTLKTYGKVKVYTNYHGGEVVTFLE